MFWDTSDFEMRLLIEKKLDKIEEMLKMAFPDLNMGSDDNIKEYVKRKAEKAGCEKLPAGKITPYEEWKKLCSISKKDRSGAVYYALVIGFMNGVEWERKKSEISS